MKLYEIPGYTEITLDSINAVKCKQIITGEGSQKYNKYIQNICKQILKLSLNRTDGHKHDEVGILARLDGTDMIKPIYGAWDESIKTSALQTAYNFEYTCFLDDNEDQSLVFVHNHPNCSKPSLEDIRSLIGAASLKAVVAVGNNGEIHFVMKLNSNGSLYNKLLTSINKHIRDDRSNVIRVYDAIINNPGKYGLFIE